MKKNIALVFCSVLFVLFLFEIVLRTVSMEKPEVLVGPKTDWAPVPERIWTEYHPVLGWYHQRNKHAILKLQHVEANINTNSQGFRGIRDYEKQKPPGSSRIVCLGDSFVFGFGVQDNETFCSQLEAKHQNLEVLNLGVAAYGMDQILMAYRTLAKDYNADYVFIGIFPEDFWRATRAFADSGHAKPYFSLSTSGRLILHNVPVPPQYQLNTNQYPDLIQYHPVEQFLLHSLVYRMIKKSLIKLGKNLRLVDPDLTVEWKIGREILNQLISEVREQNQKPVLLLLPPDRWVKSARVDSLRKSVIRFSKKENVDLIDLTPGFYEAVQIGKITDYYIEGDWHWTAKGHELASDLISRYLTERTQKV